jgi:hypothetical protein
MSIPSSWPHALDFLGTPLVVEPSPGNRPDAMLHLGQIGLGPFPGIEFSPLTLAAG